MTRGDFLTSGKVNFFIRVNHPKIGKLVSFFANQSSDFIWKRKKMV